MGYEDIYKPDIRINYVDEVMVHWVVKHISIGRYSELNLLKTINLCS